MTAQDFIAKLPAVDLDRLSRIFGVMAFSIPDARLKHGGRLNDGTDFAAWLKELAEAARAAGSAQLKRASELRRIGADDFNFVRAGDPCPRCGHVHQGSSECGEPMGGGRICRCELEVRA